MRQASNRTVGRVAPASRVTNPAADRRLKDSNSAHQGRLYTASTHARNLVLQIRVGVVPVARNTNTKNTRRQADWRCDYELGQSDSLRHSFRAGVLGGHAAPASAASGSGGILHIPTAAARSRSLTARYNQESIPESACFH